jgi:hypothetical protein
METDPASSLIMDDIERKLYKFKNLAEELKLLPPPLVSEEEVL